MQSCARILLLLLACAGAARADDLDDAVRKRMAEGHIPGVTLAAIRDGKVVTTRAYGKADLENDVPAAADSVYEIGSVTKQFTAVLVMMLVEQGKVKLEDHITQLLPGLPAAWKEVTVRHLLTHTSGIPGYTEVGDFREISRNEHTPEEIVKIVAKTPLKFSPGERWDYSNTGYYLLGMLIQKVTGQNYWDVLTERIFKPLGMKASRDGNPRAVIPHRVRGYAWKEDHYVNQDPLDPTGGFSAGSIVSTVGDMAKWDAALDTEQLLKQATLKQMWTPAALDKGGTANYGFGWMIERMAGHPMIAHGGGTLGFSSFVARFPKDRLSVVVLTNAGHADAQGIAFLAARHYVPDLTPSFKPIEDKDPDVTRLVREQLEKLAQGKPDLDCFTPEAAAAFRPIIPKAAADLKQLGAVRELFLIERADAGPNRRFRYRIRFRETDLTLTCVVTPEGKIAGLTLSPE